MPSTWARSDAMGRLAPAHWYDGVSARRHEGTLYRGEDGALWLEGDDGSRRALAAGDLVRSERQPGRTIFTLTSAPAFRLILPGAEPAQLAALVKTHSEYGGWIDRLGLGRAALAFAAVSAALVAAVLTAPDWLGPRIPSAWERTIGDAMVGDVERRVCKTPESDAALKKLLAALDPGTAPVRAGIANIGMVNAVALPGERVLLFDGLVREAKTAEELAGVLAHEIGHVRERHVMTAMMRQFGLSILLAGADSGILSNASGIAALGYTRSAEREADAFARARLARADISPLGAAGFFERLVKEGAGEDTQRGLAAWTASHPAAGERAKQFRAAAKTGHRYPPALTTAEFAALKNACRRDEDVMGWDWF